jgi:hemerythrin-like domain-containing protein
MIERGRTLLEKGVARIDAGQPLPAGFPQWAPRSFRQFADRCHHAGEEDVFVPALKRRGLDGGGLYR